MTIRHYAPLLSHTLLISLFLLNRPI